MKTWNEQQRAAIRRQSKEQLARDYETFAIQSTMFMRQRDELLDVCRELLGPMIVWSQHWANHYNGGKPSPAHEEIIQRASVVIARNTPSEDAE